MGGAMVAETSATRGPKVSVLLPTYNYGRYLRQAIESVLKQDFADFELIISDDASTDDSAEIIASFVRGDPRVRAVVQPTRLGMVENWNWCLRQARGEYVKFLFGDDCFVQRNALKRYVAALDLIPEASLAASARLLINEDGRETGIWNDLRNPGCHHGIEVIGRCMQEDRNLIGEPSAVIFRREAAGRGFDPAFRQVVDQEFWFHLLLQGDCVYIAEPLCAFRRHECQQTQVNNQLYVGPMESLIIMARYIDAVSNPEAGGLTTLQRHRMVYHRLYYSRKNAPRSAGILVAEAAARSRLSRSWLFLMWLNHRLSKPLINLIRFSRRHLTSAPPTTVHRSRPYRTRRPSPQPQLVHDSEPVWTSSV